MEDLNKELKDLEKQAKLIEEEVSTMLSLGREVEKKIEKIKLDIFEKSNVLKEIGWIIKIGKNEELYITPQSEGYSPWIDKLFKAYKSTWHHYSICMENYTVYVNDSDVYIQSENIVKVIKDLGLNIVGNDVSKKKKEIEDHLKKILEMEDYLINTKP